MKNNEFNKVTIKNEGASASYEFLGLPKEEAVSVVETVKPYKDELNSRKVNNDIIEANTLNKDRKAGGLKKDYKQMKHGPIHLASTAGHAVVAATTISIAAVATAVGMTLMVQEEEPQDLISFTYSNVGVNSVSFGFVIDSRYIDYYDENDPVGSDEKEELVTIRGILENENEYQELEFEEYSPYEPDESFYEYYGSAEGLQPGTGYALTLNLIHYTYGWELNPETQQEEYYETIVSSTQLAYRTFTTKTSWLTFTAVNAGEDYIVVEFTAPKSYIDWSREEPSMGRYLEATISNEEGYWDYKVIDNYSELDNGLLLGLAGFYDLQPDTEYTISMVYNTERAAEDVASITVTTSSPSYFFDSIIFGENASFYNHTFDVKLLYSDDFDNPHFTDFALTLYDRSYNTLETFELEAVSNEPQTLTVHKSSDPTMGEQFDYDLDQEFFYSLFVFDTGKSTTVTLVDHGGPLNFNDSDISNFMGFGNQTFEFNRSESICYTPFSLSFVDEGHKWNYFTVALEYEYTPSTTGITQTVVFESSTLDPIANRYQRAAFYEDTETNLTLADFGYDTADIYVYANGENSSHDDAIYSTTGVLYQATDWEFLYYSVGPYELYDDGSNNMNFDFVCTAFEDVECYGQIIFEDVNTDERFIYNLGTIYYTGSQYSFSLQAIYETENVDPDSGYQWAPYANLQATYEGRTFNVIFSYYTQSPGSSEQSETTQILIDENVELIFN